MKIASRFDSFDLAQDRYAQDKFCFVPAMTELIDFGFGDFEDL